MFIIILSYNLFLIWGVVYWCSIILCFYAVKDLPNLFFIVLLFIIVVIMYVYCIIVISGDSR